MNANDYSDRTTTAPSPFPDRNLYELVERLGATSFVKRIAHAFKDCSPFLEY